MKLITEKWFCLIFLVVIGFNSTYAQNQVITLTWEDVVSRSLSDNLSIKSLNMDYNSQNLSKWQALTSFLPSVSYGGVLTKNIELPVMTMMGQTFTIGTKYSYGHSFQLVYPIFTGLARLSNYKLQNSLQKSLKQELEGQKDEVVLNALQAYFGVMLANSLIEVNTEAVAAAKSNLEEVKHFYEVGAASQLDLKRAEANYYSTLPGLESSKNNKKTTLNQLKFILNISLEDSLVILDKLDEKDFLGDNSDLSIENLKSISLDNRSEIKMIEHQSNVVAQQKNLVLAEFAPTVSFVADLSFNAMRDKYEVTWNDYIRSKSIYLNIQWSLFEGGNRALALQKANIEIDKMGILEKQTHDQVLIDVEQNYFNLQVSSNNLVSLKSTFDQATESMRLANLMYKEGMSTQVEVLDAQTFYTQTRASLEQGIYQYNIDQLSLLKSIGKIKSIWE